MPRIPTWLALLTAAATAGCGGLATQRARDAALARELDAAPIARPMDEVWQETRLLLADLNIGLAEADARAIGQDPGLLQTFFSVAVATSEAKDGSRSLETARSPAGVRYRAVARPVEGGVRVELTRSESELSDRTRDVRSRRDLQLELALLRRLAPGVADGIEARVKATPAPR